jgi:hypothetical protein
MAEPTLVQLFGAGASQTATQLLIEKAALSAIGLQAGATNTGESLLMCLILIAAQQLTQTNLDANIEQHLVIEPSTQENIVLRNGQRFRQTVYTIEVYSPEPDFSINVNNF